MGQHGSAHGTRTDDTDDTDELRERTVRAEDALAAAAREHEVESRLLAEALARDADPETVAAVQHRLLRSRAARYYAEAVRDVALDEAEAAIDAAPVADDVTAS